MTEKTLERLLPLLQGLNKNQITLVGDVVQQFSTPHTFTCSAFQLANGKELITQEIANDLGDIIRVHHAFSREAFSKDKFEYALERVQSIHGRASVLAPRGNRGYDIEIEEERFSLKTEASAKIQANTIHISKFMELGGGKWDTDPGDLEGLRQQFLTHLDNYDHILTLRRLRDKRENWNTYELVLIPKQLLASAAEGVLVMMENSSQNPRPGYCYLGNEGWTLPAERVRTGDLKFSLYFDGGGERKLQIKHLKKDLCQVLATWEFESLAAI